jgi:hypothetical protein
MVVTHCMVGVLACSEFEAWKKKLIRVFEETQRVKSSQESKISRVYFIKSLLQYSDR